MRLVLLTNGQDKEVISELKKILSFDYRNHVEQYIFSADNLQKIQLAEWDMVITFNLAGFEFTTLTGGLAYNLWNTKFVHFLLGQNLKNEVFLQKPLSISMHFYCNGDVDNLKRKYPNLPYVKEIDGWINDFDQSAVKRNAEKMAVAIYKTAKICGLYLNLPRLLEAEIYFQKLKSDQEKINLAVRHIDETLNDALEFEDTSLLLSLIPYMESGEGKYAWEYKSEARTILRILYVIRLETEYGFLLFSFGCETKEELMEKYTLMIFALRRFKFWISDSSKAEAEQFLLAADLTPFALHMALQSELLFTGREMYRELENLYADFWEEEKKILFAKLAETVRKECR